MGLHVHKKPPQGTIIPLPIKIAFFFIVLVAAIAFFLLFPPLLTEELRVHIWIGLFLSLLAGLVGAAMLLIIYQARKDALFSRNLMDKIASQRQDIQTLFAISKTITTTMQFKPLLNQIIQILMQIVDAKSGVLWLVDQGALRRCREVLGCGDPSCPAFASADRRCWSFTDTLCFRDSHPGASLQDRLAHCLQCPVLMSATLRVAVSVGSVEGMKEPEIITFGDGTCREVLLKNPMIQVFHVSPSSGNEAAETCYQQVTWASRDLAGRDEHPKLVPARSCVQEEIANPMTRIGVALVTKNQIHGMLCLGMDRVHYVTEDEAMLITNAASLAAAALENADLYYQMEKRNQQITTLLKESHHRIKNNLQAIAGICSMQLQQTNDPATVTLIFDNLARIRSISLVHQLLSQEDVKFVSLIQMIRKVVEMGVQLSNGSRKTVGYEIQGDDVKISSQKATALALIINELTTNSIKHGFSGTAAGSILITLSPQRENRVTLTFSDDGKGLPEEFSPEMCGSLGLQLVSNLVRDDLRGSFTLTSGRGTRAVIDFVVE